MAYYNELAAAGASNGGAEKVGMRRMLQRRMYALHTAMQSPAYAEPAGCSGNSCCNFHLTSRTECDIMKRGDIYRADLDPVVGSEQGGVRPVVIIQNDIGNRHSPTVIVAAVTSSQKKAKLPVHVSITAQESGLPRDSVVLTEQVRTLEKTRLTRYLGTLPEETMRRIDQALQRSLGTWCRQDGGKHGRDESTDEECSAP